MNSLRKLLLAFALISAIMIQEARAYVAESVEESYSSNSQVILQNGRDQLVPLITRLGLRNGDWVESLVIVAATAGARGTISVELNGRTIHTWQLSKSLESQQIAIRSVVGRSEDRLRLRTSGIVQIAHVGATINSKYSDRDRWEETAQLVSNQELAALLKEMSHQSFDSGKTSALVDIASTWQGRSLDLRQLGVILRVYSWDQGRMDAIRILKRQLVVNTALLSEALDTFSFSSSRDAARKLILEKDQFDIR